MFFCSFTEGSDNRTLNTGIIYQEKELLSLVAGGDEFAFRQLFDAYRQKIYGLGLHLTHSTSAAEEIVQEVFLRIWLSRSRLTEVNHFPAYLKTIARNVAIDHLKWMASEKLLRNELNTAGKQTEEPGLLREYERIHQEAIETLSPARKRAYLLSRQAGLKNEEIATEMNISLHTVKDHLKLATKQVRTYVEGRIGSWVAVAIATFLQ